MGRRAEIALGALALVGILAALAYLAARFPARLDMSEGRLHTLSAQSVAVLQRVDRPVRIVFFHDPMMRETVELYQQAARQNSRITVEFHDPMRNPAQARLAGVGFAGTAVMESEGRKLQVHGGAETDIVNGILRVSQGVTQTVCFLDGHGEANPFSTEAHDHLEGAAGHTHGLGQQFVLHEEHGMAKARHSLEALNYKVEKLALLRSPAIPAACSVVVAAGPKTALLPPEVDALARYLAAGGKALLMLDPFVPTGLEPLLREYGVVLDNRMVIDETHHFWADRSAPAVTDYNHHLITRGLPLTFFPGAQSLSPTRERVPGVSVIPLANSSRQSWAQAERRRVEFRAGRDLPGPNTLMAIATRRPVAPGSALAEEFGPRHERGRKAAPGSGPPALAPASAVSRIVVVGDSDFATNSFFHIMGNGRLFLNAVNYLAARENLVGIEPRTRDLPRVQLTNRQVRIIFFLSMILLPALLALAGGIVWWKQR